MIETPEVPETPKERYLVWAHVRRTELTFVEATSPEEAAESWWLANYDRYISLDEDHTEDICVFHPDEETVLFVKVRLEVVINASSEEAEVDVDGDYPLDEVRKYWREP